MSKSKNTFAVTGHLTFMDSAKKERYTTNSDKSFVRFTMAHNFGREMPVLFLDVVAFDRNGKKKVNIPFDVLDSGKAVEVSGYMRPNTYVNKAGKKIRKVDFVALTIKAMDDEPGDDENDGEEA